MKENKVIPVVTGDATFNFKDGSDEFTMTTMENGRAVTQTFGKDDKRAGVGVVHGTVHMNFTDGDEPSDKSKRTKADRAESEGAKPGQSGVTEVNNGTKVVPEGSGVSRPAAERTSVDALSSQADTINPGVPDTPTTNPGAEVHVSKSVFRGAAMVFGTQVNNFTSDSTSSKIDRVPVSIELQPWERIVVSGACKVNIDANATPGGVLYAPQSLVNQVKFNLIGDTLFIEAKDGLPVNGIEINLCTRNLTHIATQGAALLNISNLHAPELLVINEGSAPISLQGKANVATFDTKLSSINASKLELDECYAHAAGIGKVECVANSRAHLVASGTARIDMTGEVQPQNIQHDVAGLAQMSINGQKIKKSAQETYRHGPTL